jgi:hypothetical protein
MKGIGTNVVGSCTISLKKNCSSRLRFSALQLNSPECSFMTTGEMLKPTWGSMLKKFSGNFQKRLETVLNVKMSKCFSL